MYLLKLSKVKSSIGEGPQCPLQVGDLARNMKKGKEKKKEY